MKTWYPGFDWLRVIFIAFVVAMHLGVAHHGFLLAESPLVRAGCFVFHYVFLSMAVPGFLLISCFLRAKKDPIPWRQQVPFFTGLLSLYVFWVGAWMLVTKPTIDFSLMGITEMALRGGGWAFYYFAVLLIVHVIRALISRWSSNRLALLSAAILILSQLVCTILSHRGYSWEQAESYWWPINFLAIPFLGTWMAKEEHSLSLATTKGKKWLMIFSIGLLLSLALDWFVAPSGDEMPALAEYLRATPTLMAIILMQVSFSIRSRPAWVGWFAKNSLGIFCLHVFVLGGIGKAVSKFMHHILVIDLITLAVTMIALSLAAEVLRYCLNKRVI